MDSSTTTTAKATAPAVADRLLRMPDVVCATGMGRSWIWAAINRGEFPAPFKLGERAVAWRASEIAEWIEKLPRHGAAR